MHYIVIMLTSPLLGALLGGSIADAFGGYEGKGILNALTLCTIFGMLATFFSILIHFTFDKMLFEIFIWLFLFFGTAVEPIAIGIIVGSAPKFAKNSASAISNFG